MTHSFTPCPASHLLRVDIFNNYVYDGKHYIQRSCLIDYGINCVNIYTFDYVHLVLLGAVKRLTFDI